MILAAAFFWGTSATLARLAFRDYQVPPLTAVELRLVIAALMLGAWLAWRDPKALVVRREDAGPFLVLGLFGLAAVQGSYYYSISVLGVGMAILIQYLAPSLIVMLDVVRGIRVDTKTLIAVCCALIGTGLLVGNLDLGAVRPTPLQWAIGFSAAVSFAFFIVYSKGRLARYRPETVLFYTFCIAGGFWALITPPWRIVQADYSATVWSIFILLAVFSTLVPFALFYAGLRRLPPTQVGILSTLEPVVAIVSAAIALGEALRPVQNLGALLVLVAAAISTTRVSGRERAIP